MPLIENLNPAMTLKKIGVKPDYLAFMSKNNVTIQILIGKIRFVKFGTSFNFEVPMTAVTDAAKGKLDGVLAEALKTELNEFLSKTVMKELHEAMFTTYTSQITAEKLAGGSGQALSELLTPAGKAAGIVPPSWVVDAALDKAEKADIEAALAVAETKFENVFADSFPISQLATAPLIPLKAASKLYTPVKGTGDTSRYFMVADYGDFKVAVRLTGQKMSVRLEGDMSKMPIATLQALSFQQSGSTHWSTHIAYSGGTAEATRFLGAALAGFGIPKTPLPALDILAGKGGY